MGSHDSFEYLKYKLWPKERSKVKVPIWFPIVKSQELLWNTCVQVACHISLENFWQGLQFFLKPHLNQKSSQEVMAHQSAKIFNFWEFQNSQLGNPGTKWHLDVALMANHREYYKGEGGGFPKSGPWWILWIHVCPRFVRVSKMFQPCINQLVVWDVKVYVNNWPTCHSS
jgi:hypothetical protein